MNKIFALLFSLVLASGAAYAAEMSFEDLDKDADGAITAEEAAADEKVNAGFMTADADQDGKLTPEEFAAIQ